MSVPDLYCFPKAHESRYADGMLVLLQQGGEKVKAAPQKY
jgi:hypothetical protein